MGFRQATFYLAELFRQGTFYLAELFRQATFYLAELFRQATIYLAELFRQIASPKKQRKKMLFNYMSKFRTNTKENERLSFKNYQEAGLSFNFYVS